MSSDTTLAYFDFLNQGPIGTAFVKDVITINDGDTLQVEMSDGTTKAMGDLLPAPAKQLTNITVNAEGHLLFEMNDGEFEFDAGNLTIQQQSDGSFPSGFGVLTSDGYLKVLESTASVTVQETEDSFILTSLSPEAPLPENVMNPQTSSRYEKIVEVTEAEAVTEDKILSGIELIVSDAVELNTGLNKLVLNCAIGKASSVTLNVRNNEDNVLLKSESFALTGAGTATNQILEVDLEIVASYKATVSLVANVPDVEWLNYRKKSGFTGSVNVTVADLVVSHTKLDKDAIVGYVPPAGQDFSEYTMATQFIARQPERFTFEQCAALNMSDGFDKIALIGTKLYLLPNFANAIAIIDTVTGEVMHDKFPPGLYRPSGVANNSTTVFLGFSGEANLYEYDMASRTYSQSSLPWHSNGLMLKWNEYLGKVCHLHPSSNWFYDYVEGTGFVNKNTIMVSEGVEVNAQDFRDMHKESNSISVSQSAPAHTWISFFDNKDGSAYPLISTKGLVEYGDSTSVLKTDFKVPQTNYLRDDDTSTRIGFAYGSRTLDTGPAYTAFMEHPTSSYYTPAGSDPETTPDWIEVTKFAGGPMSFDSLYLREDPAGSYGPASRIVVKGYDEATIPFEALTVREKNPGFYGETAVNFAITNLFKLDTNYGLKNNFDAWQVAGQIGYLDLELNEETLIKQFVTRNGYITSGKPPASISLLHSMDGVTWEQAQLIPRGKTPSAAEEKGRFLLDTPVDCIGIRIKTPANASQRLAYWDAYIIHEDEDGNLYDHGRRISELRSNSDATLIDGTIVTMSSVSGVNGINQLFLEWPTTSAGTVYDYANDTDPYIQYVFPETRKVRGFLLNKLVATDANTENNIQYTTDGETWVDLTTYQIPEYRRYLQASSPAMSFYPLGGAVDEQNEYIVKTPFTAKFLRFDMFQEIAKYFCLGRLWINRAFDDEGYVIHDEEIPEGSGQRETTLTFDQTYTPTRARIECHGVHGTSTRWRIFDAFFQSNEGSGYVLENINSDTKAVNYQARLSIENDNAIDETEFKTMLSTVNSSRQLFPIGDDSGIAALWSIDFKKLVVLKNNAFLKELELPDLETLNFYPGKGTVVYQGADKVEFIDSEGNLNPLSLGMGTQGLYDGYSIADYAFNAGVNMGDDKPIAIPAKGDLMLQYLPETDKAQNINFPANRNYFLDTAEWKYGEACYHPQSGKAYAPPCDQSTVMVIHPVGVQAKRLKMVNGADGSVGYLAVPDTLIMDEEYITYKRPEPNDVSMYPFSIMRNAEIREYRDTCYWANPNDGKDWYVEFGFTVPIDMTGIDFISGYSVAQGRPDEYQIYTSEDGETWNLVKTYTVDQDEDDSGAPLSRCMFDTKLLGVKYMRITAPFTHTQLSVGRIFPITDEETFTTDPYWRATRVMQDESDPEPVPWDVEDLSEKYRTVMVWDNTHVLALPYLAHYPMLIDTTTDTWSVVKQGAFSEMNNNRFTYSFRLANGRVVGVRYDGSAVYINEDFTTEEFPITFEQATRRSVLGKDGYRYFLSDAGNNNMLRINMINLMNSVESYGGITGSNGYYSGFVTTGNKLIMPRAVKHATASFTHIDILSTEPENYIPFPYGTNGFRDVVRLSNGNLFLVPDGNQNGTDFLGLLRQTGEENESDADFDSFMELEG